MESVPNVILAEIFANHLDYSSALNFMLVCRRFNEAAQMKMLQARQRHIIMCSGDRYTLKYQPNGYIERLKYSLNTYIKCEVNIQGDIIYGYRHSVVPGCGSHTCIKTINKFYIYVTRIWFHDNTNIISLYIFYRKSTYTYKQFMASLYTYESFNIKTLKINNIQLYFANKLCFINELSKFPDKAKILNVINAPNPEIDRAASTYEAGLKLFAKDIGFDSAELHGYVVLAADYLKNYFKFGN